MQWDPTGPGRGGGCGPATIPSPAPSGAWRFVLPPAGAWSDGATDSGVTVAVLDTWPDLRGVANDPSFQRLEESNEALRSFMQDVRAGRVKTDAFAGPTDLARYPSNADSDHGLFVAGIVNSIAPHADLHILHVLDDRGYGRAELILEALDYCAKTLAAEWRRLVVNLSLFFLIAPDDAPPGTEAGAESSRRLASQIKESIDRLIAAGAVVVAAAGNDALDYEVAQDLKAPLHVDPRLPADLDGVICVVATDRDGKIAAYSNHADTRKHNSVATWGGQGELDRQASKPGQHPVVVVPEAADGEQRDGVAGLYALHTVQTADGRGPGERNETGWVYWSGTSFATPIISAIAANLLARDPALSPPQVLEGLAGMAEPPGHGAAQLGCPYIKVSQQRR